MNFEFFFFLVILLLCFLDGKDARSSNGGPAIAPTRRYHGIRTGSMDSYGMSMRATLSTPLEHAVTSFAKRFSHQVCQSQSPAAFFFHMASCLIMYWIVHDIIIRSRPSSRVSSSCRQSQMPLVPWPQIQNIIAISSSMPQVATSPAPTQGSCPKSARPGTRFQSQPLCPAPPFPPPA